jgi:hypothetical protein
VFKAFQVAKDAAAGAAGQGAMSWERHPQEGLPVEIMRQFLLVCVDPQVRCRSRGRGEAVGDQPGWRRALGAWVW